ncbi:hypothetical protein HanPI659440_Chr14g0528071 [Helianthus annuus]|nr:hypothetical protein HanPI659440_Chr14g0528071 [Helianthus annuus]
MVVKNHTTLAPQKHSGAKNTLYQKCMGKPFGLMHGYQYAFILRSCNMVDDGLRCIYYCCYYNTQHLVGCAKTILFVQILVFFFVISN